ncbi:MAG: hypothetical protein AB1813_14120 [Verrucomicrobiota bacterium]
MSLLSLGVVAGDASPRLAITKTQNGGLQLQVNGQSSTPLVLQSSNDLKVWQDIQTLTLSGLVINIPILDSGGTPHRFFQLRSPAASLPDLSQMPNRVFVPGEGFDTLQFSPSGKLGLIVWRDRELVYRERSIDGTWSESVLSNAGRIYQPADMEEYRFQPMASLHFDSRSQPHVLLLDGSSVLHFARSIDGNWTSERIAVTTGSGFVLFVSAMGSGDKLHMALVSTEGTPAIIYGSNKTGPWKWERAATLNADPRGFTYLRQSYAPRFFSMAVDSRNQAHIAFTPEFKLPVIDGYARPASELHYLSNRSGSWQSQMIWRPADGSGDAGLGASIAVGPDDLPAITHWYNERAATGSSQSSELLFHRLQPNGSWNSSVIARNADGYTAGDGDKGTGFAPYLRYDFMGRAHIVFSDHASQHFPLSGQNEYAGQIRHAWFDGVRWNSRTLMRQADPLKVQIVFPAMAISATELVVIGLERNTQWAVPDTYWRPVTSTYFWKFQSVPMP